MIKLMFIVSYLNGGGAEHVARKNIECFSNDSNYEIAVITADGSWIPDDKKIKVYKLVDFRTKKSIIKIADSMYLKDNMISSYRYLNEFRPDIIHIHDFIPFSPTLLKAIKYYKEISNCKVIMTHHTYSYICTNDALFNYTTNTLCDKCIGSYNTDIIKSKCAGSITISIAKYIQKNIFKKYMIGLVDLHISPSEFLKSKLLEVYKNLYIKLVYNPCIDEIEISATKNKKNIIVFFGRINREKNIVPFTKYFCEAKLNMKLLIIGDGNATEDINKLINQYPDKDIEFINQFLSTEELYKKLSNAKYFVLPSSWYENSPVSIVEGINKSIIPIVNCIGGMRELVDLFGVGHMINMNEKNDVLNFLNNIDYDTKEYDEVFLSTREKLNYFTIDYYKSTVETIYKNLLNC